MQVATVDYANPLKEVERRGRNIPLLFYKGGANMIKINNITKVDTGLLLEVSGSEVLENLKEYKMVICKCVNVFKDGLTCWLVVGGKQIPLLTNAGNVVKSEQLQSRKCYRVVYGDKQPHILILTKLKPAD